MVFKVGAVLALVVLGTLAEIVTGTVVALGAVLAGIGLAIIYVQLRGREQGRGRGNGAVIITALGGGAGAGIRPLHLLPLGEHPT